MLSRLIEIRHVKEKKDLVWYGFNPLLLSQHDAIRLFLLHKKIQAHLIGQFVNRKIYVKNIIPNFICYEDFAVFPHLLMNSKKILYQPLGYYYYFKRIDSVSSKITPAKTKLLIKCTSNMEKIFPSKYKNLIDCHWIDIYIKHYDNICPEYKSYVCKRINEICCFSFFTSLEVSINYKKKFIQAKRKIKTTNF